MIYLASPYSHPDPAIREQRFQAACRAAASLIRAGEPVFSPIAHSHPIAAYGLPTDWAFWERDARLHLTASTEVVVLTLDGWRASVGVASEIAIARELGKPVRYLSPEA
jgi:nucleoside 2-deoxyribosyltransferase